RGWQIAARHAYRGNADAVTLASLLGALGEWARRGCAGINEIAEVVAGSGRLSTTEARQRIRRELEQVQRTHLCTSTNHAVEAALRLTADDGALPGRLPEIQKGEINRQIVG